MRVFLLFALLAKGSFAQTFGTWTLNSNLSTFSGDNPPKSLTLRIAPHAQGEVLTFDRVETDGRSTSSSTILYLDQKPRDFQDFGCAGTQSSRRGDTRTVEIVRKCGVSEWIISVRRASPPNSQLVLEMTEHRADGRRLERKMTLEKR